MALECLQHRRWALRLLLQLVLLLGHPYSRNMFPGVQVEHHVFQFAPTASCPVTGYHWNDPGSIFFKSSLQVLVNSLPTSLVFSRLNSSRPLSLSSAVRCSNALIILMDLCKIRSSSSFCLLHWEASTEHSTRGVSSLVLRIEKDHLPPPAYNTTNTIPSLEVLLLP